MVKYVVLRATARCHHRAEESDRISWYDKDTSGKTGVIGVTFIVASIEERRLDKQDFAKPATLAAGHVLRFCVDYCLNQDIYR